VLILEHFNFNKRAVLAKVGKAQYHFPARTGDRLEYHVRLDAVQDDGATIIGTSHCDGKLQADVNLMFAFLEDGHLFDGPLYKPGDLSAMLRLMNFFHVAVDADGNLLNHYENL
jgi:3-hydroxyacyl-[acyl-carrier-protein] dehydratase